ncbi:class I SAM-dependent methyltransferase [Frankia sp. CNm7]|uniref:Class I SAM-dependent methyltransferase n=1 Tax=Frankia nepalensis TaxID=1836974 RepID=A0A937ULS4_9ACTN|nr:class I SAM-dependent methyltransferase [Frankia nepalensis]MBL7495793.1 class I SAM-dependent methyltransferase [Frankia nepalensis]MBL7513273.1 class I SAM-dependent methyltransferase [Frankia nepalensis]MBL7523775.1 class I SAM-dependent methyltransferase [Frankia nepalensis]MBL7628154.1 class I SAM-dependent methyltransferase [Frankia nepalensis]
MVNQYDVAAANYTEADMTAFRTCVESYSFLRNLGSVAGRSVLDVACGEGFYSRQFAELGAARVVAVDASAEMVRHGREAEQAAPLGIEYHVHDAAEMPVLGEFDLVAATYLLHYAADTDHMRSMCARMVANLRPGGRFVTLVPNPELDPAGPGHLKYGFSLDWPSAAADGDEVVLNIPTDPPMALKLRYWSRRTYTEVLATGGFSEIEWCPLECAPDAEDLYGPGFFDDYLANPHAMIVRAVRPAG